MKKALFLSVALMCAASMGFAQEKAVKDAKRAANSQTNPDFAKAEQLINGALTNPETKDKANTWDVAGFIQRRKLEEETKKIIIPGTPYDTLGYYTSALNMCKYFFKCDELAQIPDEKNKVKNKYRKRNATTMMNERRNLYDGGVTFFNEGLKKSQAGDETGAADCNRKALDFWGTYVDMAGHEMFSEDDRQTMLADSMYTYAAYYATMVANAVKDYASVMKYAPIAEGNAENHGDIHLRRSPRRSRLSLLPEPRLYRHFPKKRPRDADAENPLRRNLRHSARFIRADGDQLLLCALQGR